MPAPHTAGPASGEPVGVPDADSPAQIRAAIRELEIAGNAADDLWHLAARMQRLIDTLPDSPDYGVHTPSLVPFTYRYSDLTDLNKQIRSTYKTVAGEVKRYVYTLRARVDDHERDQCAERSSV